MSHFTGEETESLKTPIITQLVKSEYSIWSVCFSCHTLLSPELRPVSLGLIPPTAVALKCVSQFRIRVTVLYSNFSKRLAVS